MATDTIRLERRIDDILNDLNLSELTKEPLSDSFNSLLEYAKSRIPEKAIAIEGVNDEQSKEEVVNLTNEYVKSIFRYGKSINSRVYDWVKIAERGVSNLLGEELGISERDIKTIQKPFYKLVAETNFLSVLDNTLHDFNFKFFIRHKNNKIHARRFFRRLKNNRCVELSELYDSSIDTLVKIIDMQVELISRETINRSYIEEVYIPLIKSREGYANEDSIKEGFNKETKHEEENCTKRIVAGKDFFIHNLQDIEYIYSNIRKRYGSLAEYFEKDVGIKSKSFFPF